jgi:hypothetical protein
LQFQQLKWAKVALVTDDPLWGIVSTSKFPVPRQRRSKKPLQLRIIPCNASGATGSARDDEKAIIGILSICQVRYFSFSSGEGTKAAATTITATGFNEPRTFGQLQNHILLAQVFQANVYL